MCELAVAGVLWIALTSGDHFPISWQWFCLSQHPKVMLRLYPPEPLPWAANDRKSMVLTVLHIFFVFEILICRIKVIVAISIISILTLFFLTYVHALLNPGRWCSEKSLTVNSNQPWGHQTRTNTSKKRPQQTTWSALLQQESARGIPPKNHQGVERAVTGHWRPFYSSF